MPRQFDFAGQSGQLYRYKSLEELRPISPGGANFLYVKWEGDVARVIFAGETDSLHRAVFETWEEAKAEHGAGEILARLNITGAVRRAEQADLVGKHKPPMNPGAPKAAAPKAVKSDAAEPAGDAVPAKKASRKAG